MRVGIGVSILITGLACVFGAGAAWSAGVPVSGKQIAERWCSGCHLVSPDQDRAAAVGTPSFAAIAQKYGDSVEVLAGFLADPHPPMPQLSLTRQEINDLVAYIGTLDEDEGKAVPGQTP